MLTIGSLFAGYGGLDMGIEAALPARTAWVSEIDPGACKVLAHRYPDVPNLGDITTIDWATVPHVDIIAGGSPCQDLSTAGRRAGMTDGTRSNLWVAMREAIANVQPTFVVWENVRGALSARADSDLEPCSGCVGDGGDKPSLRALGRVLGDLAELGFDAEVRGLRAADVGACHGRYRVFLLAWRRAAFADPHHAGLQGLADPQGAPQAERHGHAEPGAGRPDLTLLPTPVAQPSGNTPEDHLRKKPGREVVTDLAIIMENGLLETGGRLLPTPSSADAMGGHERRGGDRRDELLLKGIATHQQFGQYTAAIARHERMIGRPAPSPTEPGRNGRPRLSAAFTEWMMGLPDGWITDVPGVTRNEALRMLGNGVVPPQAAAALTDMWRHAIEAEARAAG